MSSMKYTLHRKAAFPCSPGPLRGEACVLATVGTMGVLKNTAESIKHADILLQVEALCPDVVEYSVYLPCWRTVNEAGGT